MSFTMKSSSLNSIKRSLKLINSNQNSNTTTRTTSRQSRAASTSTSSASTSSTSSNPPHPSATSPSAPLDPRLAITPREHQLKSPSLVVGPTQLNRLEEHYRKTLSTDLLYMTYEHPSTNSSSSTSSTSSSSSTTSEPSDTSSRLRSWDETSPYSQNRPSRPLRGNRRLSPLSKPMNIDSDPLKDLVQLDKIILTCFSKEAIGNKHVLVPLLSQFRSITGLSILDSNSDPQFSSQFQNQSTSSSSSSSYNPKTRGYIKILKAKSGVASFKLRPGMPVGIQAVLPGPLAKDFLEILTTFVLPRLRSFNGFPLPPASQPNSSPAAQSGVVSLGLKPDAMSLFPQNEVNWDMYGGKSLGFQIDCITNQRGPKATDKARALLSGMGVPFVRRGDMS